ncbi:protein phosphatase 1 regulatory subunit 1A isoform X2 [Hyperolius riggenbachi]|uniref:protein phosphatase 1 regulatory subunit 1A isoform X2 n=1 Tax=Hyperolius riggenbachi TaxID=752182 RepID=UPI0035A2ED59
MSTCTSPKPVRFLLHTIRRRRPTPATLVLSSDQSSPDIDEEWVPNTLQKSTLSMSPHQRKKVSRTTPTMKELQLLAEHHLCKQGSEDESAPQSHNSVDSRPSLGCCCHGNTAPVHASQQTSSCSCFMQDGQQENNSLGREGSRHLVSSEGLSARQTNTDIKESREKEHSSHITIVEDK